eukprot:1367637-Amorphochlora_amoeboformis.AAC.1
MEIDGDKDVLEGWVFVQGWMPKGVKSLGFEPEPHRTIAALSKAALEFKGEEPCFAFTPSGAFYGKIPSGTEWVEVMK